MAKRVFTNGGVTYTASAVNAAATQWMAVKGAAATQIVDVLEVLISGMATASTVAGFVLSHVSTLESAAGGSVLAGAASDGPEVVTATAIASPVVVFVAASTTGPVPTASTTLPRLNLGLNAFGGIIRWNAAPTQQWTQVGNGVNGGESCLFNSSSHGGSGGAQASSHIIYEPY